MSNKDKDKKSRRPTEEVDALKERVLLAKKVLPPGAVTLFISRFPEFNTYKKSIRVRNVHALRIVDEEITAKFETLAAEYQAEVKKGNINTKTSKK